MRVQGEQPSKEQPSKEQPSKEQPSNEQPSNEQPSNEQPSNEQSGRRFRFYVCMNVFHLRIVAPDVACKWAAVLALAMGPGSSAGAAPKQPRSNAPVVALPLAPLGYTGSPARAAGSGTLYTLHFVDETHLLLTYNSRGLMSRLPDSTPGDDDRLVAAVLVELPSGKVLARTTWRTRDRDQYLWSLGHGSFLLRIRERLTVLQPLRNLGTEHPFAEQPFLEMKRRVAYVTVSPGGDLLTVETAPPRRQEPTGPGATLAQTPSQTQGQATAQATAAQGAQGAQGSAAAPQLRQRTGPPGAAEAATEPPGRPPVELHFFRLFMTGEPGKAEHLAARTAGLLASRSLVNLPVTSEGFLDVLKEKGQVYDFDFETHTGKRVQLAAYDTTCAPRPYFVSRSEFVAFGCHGSTGKVEISGFNLRGEEPWVSVLTGQHIAPAIVSAPAASRFALSRVLVSTGGAQVDADSVLPDEILSQEIAVLQNHDGRVLLKLQVTPVQRSGQNFDLSADGLWLALVRNETVEVYRLPALTEVDRKDLQLAAASEPERNEAAVRLITEKKVAAAAPADAVTVPAAPAVAAEPAATAPAATVGDVHPSDGPRKAPSLYDADHPKPPH